ncbi:hypothetical protein K4I79_005339 [Candida tropicalis]
MDMNKILETDNLYAEEEDCIAEFIDLRIDNGWGITKHEVIALACRLGRKRNPEFAVGRVWYEAFMKKFKRFALKRSRRSIISILLEGDMDELQNWKEETKFNQPKGSKNKKSKQDEAAAKPKKKKRAPTEFVMQREKPKRKTKSQLAEGKLKINPDDDESTVQSKVMQMGGAFEIRRAAWKLLNHQDDKIREEILRRLGEEDQSVKEVENPYIEDTGDVYSSAGEEDDE